MAVRYAGSAGNDQKIFLKDTEIGWKKVLHDASLHVSGGRSQYEYQELVLEKLTGPGRKCMENHLIRWNWKLTEVENPNLEAAIAREADRSVWRIFYHDKAVHDLQKVQFAKVGAAPIRPDERPVDPILEPPDLEEFYDAIKEQFAHASTNYLSDLHAFRALPKESLANLSARFDEVADTLVAHKQMSARHLALHFVNHIPPWIRRVTEAEMKRTDKKRRKKKEPLVTKDELLQMAKDHEAELLESEAEQRAASLRPPARGT